jgi:hypothetical protein
MNTRMIRPRSGAALLALAFLLLVGAAACREDEPVNNGVEMLTLEEAVARAIGILDATVTATSLQETLKDRIDSGVEPCTNPFEDEKGRTRSITTAVALGSHRPADVLLAIAKVWREQGFDVQGSDEMIRRDPDPRLTAESEGGKVRWGASISGPTISLGFETVCLPSRAG